MKKKFLSIFLALCMCMTLLPTTALAMPSTAGEDVSYINESGQPRWQVGCTPVTSSEGDVTWNTGWYVVNTDLTISGQVELSDSAEVNLILCDGATLTVTGGVDGSNSNVLNIYGQTAGTGELKVTGAVNMNTADKAGMYIGCLTVNGGDVSVTCDANDDASSSTLNSGIHLTGTSDALTINGGKLTATAGTIPGDGYSRGIYMQSGKLAVNGGTLIATGGTVGGTGTSYGIYAEGGDIAVSGGTVNVKASGSSVDIYLQSNDLSVTGGTVQKTGTTGGAVKVLIGKDLKVTGGTIRLAKDSKIYNSITVDDVTRFNRLLALWCGYFKSNGTNSTEVSGIYNTQLTTSDDDYILIKSSGQPMTSYLDENGNQQTCVFYTKLDSGYVNTRQDSDGNVTIGGSWYIVETDVTITGTLTIADGAEVYLIICDGQTLTLNGGLKGNSGAKLHIYGQNAKNGELKVNGAASGNNNYAIYMDGGTLEINSGKVTATGGTATEFSYGIYTTGLLTVNGGELTATGGAAGYSYGISCMQNSCDITVNGGTLKATGGTAKDSYGIYLPSGGTLKVRGGELIAEGGTTTTTSNNGYNAGIFSPAMGSYSITVENGGTLTATGNTVSNASYAFSAGIFLSSYAITVKNGGKLTTIGGDSTGTYEANSYGIFCKTLTVKDEGSIVTAKGGTATSDGGGGAKSYDIDSSMTVSGGTVQSDADGAAVLVCDSADGSVSVSGGTMKLAENSVMTSVSVSGGVLTLLEAEHAYQNISDDTFVEAVNVTSLIGGVKVAQCTAHSVEYGICAYCGKDLGAAPMPDPTPSTPTYTVSIPTTENGSVSVSPKNAKKGTSVNIAVTPDSGFTLETLTILDKNGNEIELTDNGDGTYSFQMPAGGASIAAVFAPERTIADFFGDVPEDAYYHDAALWAAKSGIASGTAEGKFSPHSSCGRAQLITFLWRAAGCPKASGASAFTDTDQDSYYAEALRWAASLGIVGGYGNGAFGPDDTITREQLAVILYRFAQTMGLDTAQDGMAIRKFADYESVSDYAAEAMTWAVSTGIIQGYNNQLMPAQPCTRAQIVTMLYRLLG